MTAPPSKVVRMSSLEQLKAHTVVVADTGDFEGGEMLSKTVDVTKTGMILDLCGKTRACVLN